MAGLRADLRQLFTARQAGKRDEAFHVRPQRGVAGQVRPALERESVERTAASIGREIGVNLERRHLPRLQQTDLFVAFIDCFAMMSIGLLIY
ncbi:hypothetical protein ACFS07_00810 [Undibacterium arcticum]